MFKNPIIAALGILLLAGCHSGICLGVGNTLDVQRHPEMVELGSHFTRTSVTYEGLDRKMPLVTGIVVQDTDGKAVGDAEKGFIAYPAPTINYDRQRDVDNGTIFIGHVFPDGIDAAGLCYFSDEESAARGGSKGHILAHSQYDPQTPFIYYWGFG